MLMAILKQTMMMSVLSVTGFLGAMDVRTVITHKIQLDRSVYGKLDENGNRRDPFSEKIEQQLDNIVEHFEKSQADSCSDFLFKDKTKEATECLERLGDNYDKQSLIEAKLKVLKDERLKKDEQIKNLENKLTKLVESEIKELKRMSKL
jgi:hypothetical protein